MQFVLIVHYWNMYLLITFFSLFLSISRIFFGFGSGDALAIDLLDFLVSNRLPLVSHLLWICIHLTVT